MSVPQHIIDSKIATAATSSVGGGLLGLLDVVNPFLETASLFISCVAGTLAIWWTIERLIHFKRNMRKGDSP